MKEIIWIFGTSASGKETFIKKVLEDAELQEKFGWDNDVQIDFAKSSIDAIGHFENDPVLEKRDNIIEEVGTVLNDNDVVLVKYQFVDSENGRVLNLVELFPDARHRIIHLNTSRDELKKRLPQKAWWEEGTDLDEYINEELKIVSDAINKYTATHEISKLD